MIAEDNYRMVNQLKLHVRMNKIVLYVNSTHRDLAKTIGISRCCLSGFLDKNRLTNPRGISKIERYIIEKEKEFGFEKAEV